MDKRSIPFFNFYLSGPKNNCMVIANFYKQTASGDNKNNRFQQVKCMLNCIQVRWLTWPLQKIPLFSKFPVVAPPLTTDAILWHHAGASFLAPAPVFFVWNVRISSRLGTGTASVKMTNKCPHHKMKWYASDHEHYVPFSYHHFGTIILVQVELSHMYIGCCFKTVLFKCLLQSPICSSWFWGASVVFILW